MNACTQQLNEHQNKQHETNDTPVTLNNDYQWRHTASLKCVISSPQMMVSSPEVNNAVLVFKGLFFVLAFTATW